MSHTYLPSRDGTRLTITETEMLTHYGDCVDAFLPTLESLTGYIWVQCPSTFQVYTVTDDAPQPVTVPSLDDLDRESPDIQDIQDQEQALLAAMGLGVAAYNDHN